MGKNLFQSRLGARDLALRDPALAAAVGAIGSSFGDEGFGDETDVGVDSDPGSAMAGFGFGFGADAAIATARPTEQQAVAAWRQLARQKARGMQRMAKIDPNMHSDVTIERYSFSLSDDFTFGTAATFGNGGDGFTGTPDTTFRPQIVTANAPAPGYGYLSNLKMSNVDVSIGPGEEDLFGLSGPSWGRTMDMPTLSTSNRARAQGRVTTFTPPGYSPTSTFTLSINFKGPANLAGGIRPNL